MAVKTSEIEKAKELYAIAKGCLDGWLSYDSKRIPAKTIAKEIALQVEISHTEEADKKYWNQVRKEVDSL